MLIKTKFSGKMTIGFHLSIDSIFIVKYFVTQLKKNHDIFHDSSSPIARSMTFLCLILINFEDVFHIMSFIQSDPLYNFF